MLAWKYALGLLLYGCSRVETGKAKVLVFNKGGHQIIQGLT